MNAGILTSRHRSPPMPCGLLGAPSPIPTPNNATHPEAAGWIARVRANGGSASGVTLAAASDFCWAIDRAGIRDRFMRLNLLAGSSISAALVPLYRGQSLGGAQLGNAIDTSLNFVSGDYTETGANGGLIGNGSNKALDTGLPVNTAPFGNLHLSGYMRSASTVSFAGIVGAYTSNGAEGSLAQTLSGAASAAYFSEENNATGFVPGAINNPVGFLLGCSVSRTDRRFFINGAQSGSTVANALTRSAYETRTAWVLARNTPNAPFYNNAIIAAYSIGLGMTASQVASFSAAMQAFQTALNRNV